MSSPNGAAPPPVHIDALVGANEPPAGVRRWHLELPRVPQTRPSWALRIQGWALGTDEPGRAVEVVVDGEPISELPVHGARPDLAEAFPDAPAAENAGFSGWLNALDLPSTFELELFLRFGERGRAKLGTLTGTRRCLPRTTGIQPILVTTYGRTGSTWLMQVLGEHPEVVTYSPFRHEPRVLTYWLEILSALAEPASYGQSLRTTLSDGHWWLGPDGIRWGSEIAEPPIEHYVGTVAVERLAQFAAERVTEFYATAAEMYGKDEPAFFAEKGPWSPNAWRTIDEMYGAAREIVLVRDPRDMLASIFAYNRKRGSMDFGRQNAASDEDFVDTVRDGMLDLLDGGRRRGAFLLRYEDLLLHPEETLPKVFSHVGVDASDHTVRGIVERATSQTSEQMEYHRTSSDPRASVGRWSTDLSPSVRARAEERLADVLEQLDYAP